MLFYAPCRFMALFQGLGNLFDLFLLFTYEHNCVIIAKCITTDLYKLFNEIIVASSKACKSIECTII